MTAASSWEGAAPSAFGCSCSAVCNRGVALAVDQAQVTGLYPSAEHHTELVSAALESLMSS